jgi:FkbM family methyltransferase
MLTLKKIKQLPNIFSLCELMLLFISYVAQRLSIISQNKYLREYHICSDLISKGIKLKKIDSYIVPHTNAFRPTIYCRRFSSDLLVYKQLCVNQEFSALLTILQSNSISVSTVIDAGGNIGISSILFQMAFPKAKFIILEPDQSNSAILKKNIELNNVNAQILQKGLWGVSTKLYFNRKFRDGAEWSISLTDNKISVDYIEALSLSDIIHNFRLGVIDLLKIDIEGGEKSVFDSNLSDLSFLNKVRVLAIEVHEEVCDKKVIENILVESGFIIEHSGEYLIAINKNIEN